MKRFMIKYHFAGGAREAWHATVAEFISALDTDSDLQGKISYVCLRESEGEAYYHLAAAVDDETVQLLQGKEFFKRYSKATREAGGGEVTVVPITLIAETPRR